MEQNQRLTDEKVDEMKERMKRVEKTIYERVEQEYAEALTSKDEEI